MSFCECPLPAALETVPAIDCGVKLDQVVKLAIQRVQATPSFDGAITNIEDEADWTTLLAAIDDTKIIVTPIISGLTFPQSESVTTGGGDNSTPFGLPEYQGEGNVTVTAMIKNAPAAVIAALEKLSCESTAQLGTARVWGYFFNRFEQIASKADYAGFEMFNIRVSSLGSEGYNSDDMHALRFDLVNSKELWDANRIYTTANFNPLSL